jgi:hypothetical protein
MNIDAIALIANLDPSVGATLVPVITEPSGCKITYTYSTNEMPLVAGTVTILNAEAAP